ncbi:immunity 49 family protein [Chamaesiphon polymorphus]|uniref:immunity 49 family protein n=1 Tax=Chamaesiphon polymorphus TaxID=2107691 RepID=UPI0015E6FE32|nr:immunity 49 family protein [Chamaesiphon polymorphus]
MIDFSNQDPLSIALTLWNIGLVSETALMAWADAMILDRAQPSYDLLELAANGAKLCLQRDTIESRPLTLTFFGEFCLRSHLLDLSCDRSAIQFIDWVSRNCGGADLEHPALLLAYQLDHLYYDLDDLPAAIELLRSEMPLLLPSCELVASTFLDRVPDLMLLAPIGDANTGQSELISEIDRHPIDLTPAEIRHLLNYTEIELLPLMLAGFERNPQAMLGGSLRELHNAIGYAVALELPHTEIQRYVHLFHTVALCHFRFGTGEEPFTANIDGKMLDFIPEAHSERMGVDTWADAIHACAIVGDRDGIRLLSTFDEDVFTDSDGACAPFDLAYDRLWVDFSNGGQNTAALLDLAIALAAQENSQRRQFVNSIRLPELRLLEAIARGDARSFNDRLLTALAAHKQFWSQPSHALLPSGWFAFPLLAACAIARDCQYFSIEVKSDYLPPYSAGKSIKESHSLFWFNN